MHDHFLYSGELDVRFRGDKVQRNSLLVTLIKLITFTLFIIQRHIVLMASDYLNIVRDLKLSELHIPRFFRIVYKQFSVFNVAAISFNGWMLVTQSSQKAHGLQVNCFSCNFLNFLVSYLCIGCRLQHEFQHSGIFCRNIFRVEHCIPYPKKKTSVLLAVQKTAS